jgi:hypothetical protein
MLTTEWNWDTFIAVREREDREVGREKAFRDMGEVARKMKVRGLSHEEIAALTSLSRELIETL